MVCNEKASQQAIEAMDKKIAGFSKRPTVFTKKGGDGGPAPVASTDTTLVAKINQEVAAINQLADNIMADITTMERDAADHKKVHLVSWAKNGCPDDPFDEDGVGIELGDALEDALKRRKEAVSAVRGRLLSQVPLITQTAAHGPDTELTDEQLLAMAKEAIANRNK